MKVSTIDRELDTRELDARELSPPRADDYRNFEILRQLLTSPLLAESGDSRSVEAVPVATTSSGTVILAFHDSSRENLWTDAIATLHRRSCKVVFEGRVAAVSHRKFLDSMIRTVCVVDTNSVGESWNSLAAFTWLDADKQSNEAAVVAVGKLYSTGNWDGYSAAPIDTNTIEHARRFARRLPPTEPPPEVAPEPDGSVGFDWYAENGDEFAVSVDATNKVAYSGLFSDGGRIRGIAEFSEVMPAEILAVLEKRFGVRRAT